MDFELAIINFLLNLFFAIKAYLTLIAVYFTVISQTKAINYVTSTVHNWMRRVRAKLNNSRKQREILMEWLRTKLKPAYWPNDFTDDWRDGITLCALIEAVVPGSCPRFDLLNAHYSIGNIKLGLSLIHKYLHVDAEIEPHEIQSGADESKFVYFLTRVKYKSAKLIIRSTIKRTRIKNLVETATGVEPTHKFTDAADETFDDLFGDEKACFVKGMGLILAVKGRRARFNIFCRATPQLNLMIEICGPHNSLCSERLSIHNPKKRISTDVIATTLVADAKRRNTVQVVANESNLKIPFYYEVFPTKIAITYVPLFDGKHQLSIIWLGQHIMGSPYAVNVDRPADESEQTSPLLTPKFLSGFQYPLSAFVSRDMNLNETATVTKRTVLKQVVIVNGQEKIVQTSCFTGYTERSDSRASDGSPAIDDTKRETILSAPKTEVKPIDSEPKRLAKQHSSASNKLNSDLASVPELPVNAEQDVVEQTLVNKIDGQTEKNEPLSVANTPINACPTIRISSASETADTQKARQKLDVNERRDSVKQNLADSPPVRKESRKSSESRSSVVSSSETVRESAASGKPISRSYLPVKNMVERWETKMSNVNTNRAADRTAVIIRPANQVKTIRRKIFEEPKTTATTTEISRKLSNYNIQDTKQFWETHNSHTARKTETYLSIDSRQECLVLDAETKPVASRADSGISTDTPTVEHIETDAVDERPAGLMVNGHRRLSRQRSRSYPDILNMQSEQSPVGDDCEFGEAERPLDESSLVGQFIDDEIPDYDSLFLGDYHSFTGLIGTDRSIEIDSEMIADLKDRHEVLPTDSVSNAGLSADTPASNSDIYPEKCEIFGAGVYYGQVGVKNKFTVSTMGGGRSYLSVGVQGADPDDVLDVSVNLVERRAYEVLYEVGRPGYYIIFVKWGDYNVADSPFICKVTY